MDMDMAEKLGNPNFYEVKQPDEETRKWMHQLFS
jgi:hypothetical protein